jgi:ferredoxin-NADP reductase
MNEKLQVKVRAIGELTERIKSYELVPLDDAGELPPFTAGSHITLYLPSGLERQYSLYNDPCETQRYCIAVQREDTGRGGSLEIHRSFRAGSALNISPPRNLFPLNERTRGSLLIAGGIGITPVFSMLHRLAGCDNSFTLIYLAKDPAQAVFLEQIKSIKSASSLLICHFDQGDPSRTFDIRGFLCKVGHDIDIYCCGPTALMDAVRDATLDRPQDIVHFEYFNNDLIRRRDENRPFLVRLERTNRTIEVKADQTILDALLSAGMDIDYSCTEGTCGTCIVPLIEGEADHRDRVLLPSERETKIAICCSRAKNDLIALDL